LLNEAKKVAAREGTSVRALIEQGLRHVVSTSKPRHAFRLRKASFKGRGLSADAAHAGGVGTALFGRFPEPAVSNPPVD
jgi:hypothetical protein